MQLQAELQGQVWKAYLFASMNSLYSFFILTPDRILRIRVYMSASNLGKVHGSRQHKFFSSSLKFVSKFWGVYFFYENSRKMQTSSQDVEMDGIHSWELPKFKGILRLG